MIPRDILQAWRGVAPWNAFDQIEHDLILSRILVEMFQDEFLSEHLIFRGGTAINKFHFSPPKRFSEDLDFTQFHEGPIKPIQSKILRLIEDIEGLEFAKPGRGGLGWKYYFDFEPEESAVRTRRIKIEINTRDHFTLFGRTTRVFEMKSPWFSGKANVTTVKAEGLMTGKMVALYDRAKGRDLFDLSEALKDKIIDPNEVIEGFNNYLRRDERSVSRAEFEMNLSRKLCDHDFREDVLPTLGMDMEYSPDEAAQRVHDKLIKKLPGAPYKGEENIFV